MKKMLKHFLSILLLAAFLVITLSGCHGKGGLSEFVIPDKLDESRTIEITFWAKNDSNKPQADIYKKAIEDFEALYPSIKVNIRQYTDYGKIYNDVITNIATNTTPDVCITYPDHIATYMTGANVVVPLDDLMSDPKYGLGGSELKFDGPTRSEMIEQFLKEGVISGIQYAIPYMRSTEACYVNKTYVEKLGYTLPDVLTWDFVWEVSEAAMAKDSDDNFIINGQKVMIPFIYKSTDNMMIQTLRQLDAGYSTEDGEILLFNDDTKEFLYTIAEHTKTGAFSTFKISSYPGNFLNAGQCLFAVDSTAGATWMGSHAPLLDIPEDQLVDFETVVLPIPQYDVNNPKMISQGPSLCVFNKRDPQEVLASWIFLQYMISNDVQIPYAETEGYVPVTSKAQHDPEYLKYLSSPDEISREYYSIKIDASKLLMAHTDDTFTTPVFNGSASLRDAAGTLIENTAKAIRRGKSVDETFMKELYSDTISLYRLDQLDIKGSGTAGKTDLGPLPKTSVILLTSLAVIWVVLAIIFLFGKVRKQNS
ncbi:MAG: extracellular solute-binding protein [Erysipelotrichaceae bacterium]|nr:extracellular solute-binding protein [Erysipelotrichaceae bacterium]MBQ3412451.1 extracellular solute-binding protein [Oscillospiraceae bacterium]